MATTHTAESRLSRLRIFRPDLEGFRAVAIVMVVAHHAGFAVFGGVDASFVLSGFLVTSMLLREVERTGGIAFGAFYARRARRLLPLATLVIGVTLLAAWIWLPPFVWRSVSLDGLAAATSSINYRLAAGSTDYFAENAGSSPFQHFWSLSIEEQFYLVWPLLFLLLMWLGSRLGLHRWVLGVGLAAVVGVSLALSIIITDVSQPWAYFGFHTRAWELGIGALVAVGASAFARMWQPLAAVVTWAGMAVIGAGSVLISQSQAIPGSVMLWPVLGTAMVIAGGCAAPRFGVEWVLRWSTVRFVGRTSYGWYLWHWPVLIIAPYAVGHRFTLVEGLVAGVVSFGLAVATYFAIEVPLKSAKALVEVPRRGLAFGARFIVASVLAAATLFATTAAAAIPPRQTAVFADPARIQQQVAEAAKVTHLPPLAAGQLPTVKNDLYPGCIAEIEETVAKPCNLGDPNGSAQMVLLGSSLAWQWIPAVNRIAQQSGRKLAVFTKGSCPAELYSVNLQRRDAEGNTIQGDPYTQCDTWRKDAYGKIAGLRPKLVIMSSRAEVQATPEVVRQTVTHFRSLGATVVVLRETPSLGFDAPECLSLHRSELYRCMADRETVFADRSASGRVAAAAIEAGATLIDPNEWLCTSRRCPTVIDEQIVYWDDHHLTAGYTSWLSPVLAAALPPV